MGFGTISDVPVGTLLEVTRASFTSVEGSQHLVLYQIIADCCLVEPAALLLLGITLSGTYQKPAVFIGSCI